MAMRLAATFLVLLFPGCVVPNSSGDSGDAGSVCEGKSTCDECLSCAQSGPCAQLISNCVESAACAGLDQCLPMCGSSQSCRDQCYAANPGGVAMFVAAERCLYCEQCPVDCAGYRDCS